MQKDGGLERLMDKVVVRNIHLTEEDVDQFEMKPVGGSIARLI